MRALYAESINAADPLSGLVFGDLPDPIPPQGWIRVAVKAASLNHHDVWTLKGVGIKADQLPMILGVTQLASRSRQVRKSWSIP
jgi:NADPH:quinone reductase-like Zn-dependent oxidoreductase